MIALLGNCQTEFLATALGAKGIDARHFWQASPSTLLRSPGRVPGELSRFLDAPDLGQHLDGRELTHQFLGLPPDRLQGRSRPELLVVNLFHEAEPLFAHREEGWAFHVNGQAMAGSREFDAWMRAHCVLLKSDPLSYFQRFGGWLARLREACPGTPVLVLSRLGHHPAFGPEPFSYLAAWEQAWQEAGQALREFTASLPGCHLIELDRVLGGLMAEEGKAAIEAHCPFLKVETADEAPGDAAAMPRQRLRRDLEHVADMWPRLADKVLDFLRLGRVEYAPHETVPAAWARPHVPERLDDEARVRLMNTGSNYDAARAVASFFQEPERDFSGMLCAHGLAMPVCHNLLHMVRAYARLRKSRGLAPWCAAQLHKIAAFTANGPAFQTRYAKALAALARGDFSQAA
ncbi:hypothetical protein dsx2_0940 [Desulfovibrio sp. X2]|uniref:hypothetical protein n=1 Tax=Desulfovibrio sp. X2 TaxID=941449 RepID=UPI000358D276|nr:hypothetical protein [Desulfovibrio sp. X2]EPR37594.1 hypothetical protein dsx2_0940 [Desulfovibrio sp. X2]